MVVVEIRLFPLVILNTQYLVEDQELHRKSLYQIHIESIHRPTNIIRWFGYIHEMVS